MNRVPPCPRIPRRQKPVAASSKDSRVHHRQAAGFTLVEMLVVISIILLLLGMVFAGIFGSQQTVLKGKALVTIRTLCGAAKTYNTEYGKWPEPASDQDLVLVLNGLVNPVTGLKVTTGQPAIDNPRALRLMEIRSKDATVRALGDEAPLALYDPWTVPYAYCFDNGRKGNYYLGPLQNGRPSNPQAWSDATAHDNQIPPPFTDGSHTVMISEGYAFFSNGPDTRTGTGQSEPGGKNPAKAFEDDVRSW